MAGDDITLAELARRLEHFHRDVHEDLKLINQRLDQYVLQAVYNAEQAALLARLGVLEGRVKDGEEQRRTVVRWLIGAVVVPVVAVIVTVFLNVRGPG